jgi:hypothetical protein
VETKYDQRKLLGFTYLFFHLIVLQKSQQSSPHLPQSFSLYVHGLVPTPLPGFRAPCTAINRLLSSSMASCSRWQIFPGMRAAVGASSALTVDTLTEDVMMLLKELIWSLFLRYPGSFQRQTAHTPHLQMIPVHAYIVYVLGMICNH